jgi:hypothetical protein
MSIVQLASILVYSLIAVWYVAPTLRKLSRADALILLMFVHVFRYVVLYLFKAQQEGYAITDVAATQIVVGDLAGAIIALAAIALLRIRIKLGIALSWLLIVESIADVTVGIHQRSIDPPKGEPSSVWWLVFNFFAPLILVSLPLIAWQLYTRRNQPLDAITRA